MKNLINVVSTVAPGREDIWNIYTEFDRAGKEVVYMAQHTLGVVFGVLTIEHPKSGILVQTYYVEAGNYVVHPGNCLIPILRQQD